MTPAEHRAACILAQAKAAFAVFALSRGEPTDLDLYPPCTKASWIKTQTAAFNALHGLATVCNIVSTFRDENGVEWHKMSAAGDLTNLQGKLE